MGRMEMNAVAVAPAGGCAVVDSWDGTIKVWDLYSRYERFTLYGHFDRVRAVAVSSLGGSLQFG
jgi:WD40 repeat protein